MEGEGLKGHDGSQEERSRVPRKSGRKSRAGRVCVRERGEFEVETHTRDQFARSS